jgi:hypothetical protein
MNNRDWRLCEVNGKRTGIVHLPSWTFFTVAGDAAKVLRVAEHNPPSAEELETLSGVALEAFRSGKVWRKPRRLCGHPHP